MNVIEFFCKRCNSKNVGKFVIHTDEVIKNAIKKNNDMMWSDFEKDQNSFMILKDEIESQYVICELCTHKNYFPLYMGARNDKSITHTSLGTKWKHMMVLMKIKKWG